MLPGWPGGTADGGTPSATAATDPAATAAASSVVAAVSEDAGAGLPTMVEALNGPGGVAA